MNILLIQVSLQGIVSRCDLIAVNCASFWPIETFWWQSLLSFVCCAALHLITVNVCLRLLIVFFFCVFGCCCFLVSAAASLFCGRGFFPAINIDEVQFRLCLVPFVGVCRIVCTIRWAKPSHHTHTHMCAVNVGVCACIYNHSCILCLIDCQIELSIENALQKQDCAQQAAAKGRRRRGGEEHKTLSNWIYLRHVQWVSAFWLPRDERTVLPS